MRDSYTLYEDKLQGEYKEIFKQIDTYFGTEKVDEDTREEHMGALLDMFLLAQEEGKPVEKITGKNMERFCKLFCSNLSWKQRVLSILDLTRNVAKCVFGISLLTLITAFFDLLGGETVNIWEVIVGAVAIIITVGCVMFGEFETRTDMYWFIGIMLVVVYVLMALLWKSARSSNVNIRNWIAHERKKLEQVNEEKDI